MSKNELERLNNITDYSKILKIYDYGQINAYGGKTGIKMPLCADKVIGKMSKIPLYGINRNHKIYNEGTIIENDNNFLTYINHAFISGIDTKGYYEDLLLHETMHFCGSDGSSVLKEGINELLTRMLAKKYNLRTSSCGYPKEVKLCLKLMEILGEDVVKQLAFIHDRDLEISFLKTFGDDIARLYMEVSLIAEDEFSSKYYSHMNEYKGITGIFKKTLLYSKIDYSKAYEVIDSYAKSKTK